MVRAIGWGTAGLPSVRRQEEVISARSIEAYVLCRSGRFLRGTDHPFRPARGCTIGCVAAAVGADTAARRPYGIEADM